ncbi:hypothetical protein N2152v2_009692 [Parachlorella kessleri]
MVEDDETPEMIMAKFAELERIQKVAGEQAKQQQAGGGAEAADSGAAAATAAWGASAIVEGGSAPAPAPALQQQQQPQQLTDEQLMEVFKQATPQPLRLMQTSMFNVRTALEDNAMLMAIDDLLEGAEERYGEDEDFSDNEDFIKAFWSDEEEEVDLFADEDLEGEGLSRRSRRSRAGLERAGSRLGRAASGKGKHNVVTTFNAQTQALIRRKVRVPDRDEILQLRIPPAPIPLSWGRTVRPYVPEAQRAERPIAVPCVGEPTPDQIATSYREVPEVAAAAKEATSSGAPFQAALISPGWWEQQGAGAGDAIQRLAKLPLPKLVPTGFVFIWLQKHHIHQACRLLNRWGYIYVENMTWVWLSAAANVLTLPSPLARASHLTLFIFRKEGEGKGIELRHQRNPDVTFDCLAHEPSGASGVPEEAFVAIETLLPTGKGKFLELWAPRGVRRRGWTHLVEVGGPES